MYNVNLSFHYNCNGFPSFATEMPCLERSEGKSCVHVMNVSTEETDWDEYSCDHEVVTTVIREHINMFPNLSTQLGEINGRGWMIARTARIPEAGVVRRGSYVFAPTARPPWVPSF
ncbi:hypothetical protein L1987_12697 [Smallanthus sonchifolius]|uniref:Uncharacterized protein n=1 Tax=Smallanthus sonchifolius TaxID=185202 RepID=A0ACB9JGN8_9ASTR|nr:hypothetical protein L1987_12697 [Smallanthus sonchifolius]